MLVYRSLINPNVTSQVPCRTRLLHYKAQLLKAIILDDYQVIDTTWRERRRMMPGSGQSKVRDKRESERISINLGVKVRPGKNITILSFHSQLSEESNRGAHSGGGLRANRETRRSSTLRLTTL